MITFLINSDIVDFDDGMDFSLIVIEVYEMDLIMGLVLWAGLVEEELLSVTPDAQFGYVSWSRGD